RSQCDSPLAARHVTGTLSLHDALPISNEPSRPSSAPPELSARRPGGPALAGVRASRGTGPGTGPDGPSEKARRAVRCGCDVASRSEEHTSELQSRENLVCRLLLEKKKV